MSDPVSAFETVMPDFPVSCRRLTPGPGYLEALCADNVSVCVFFTLSLRILIDACRAT